MDIDQFIINDDGSIVIEWIKEGNKQRNEGLHSKIYNGGRTSQITRPTGLII